MIEHKLLTQEQLEECLEEQRLTREYLGAILLKKKLLQEEDLMKALAEQFNLSYVSLKTLYIDWNACLQFAPIVLAEKKALPIRQDDLSLTIAIANPLDIVAVGAMEEMARPKKIKIVLVSPHELEEFVQECSKRTKGSLNKLLRKE